MEIDKLCSAIIGAAFEVRRHLGRFLYEDAYRQAMYVELLSNGIPCEQEVYPPVYYKEIRLDKAFRFDLLVAGSVPIELKALSKTGRNEYRQIMSYLMFSKHSLGYLMNFGAYDFKASSLPADDNLNKGIYRIINSKASNRGLG